jgi:hypothetical protein
MPQTPFRVIWAVVVVCLTVLTHVAAQEPNLTQEQIHQFLLNAKIMKSKNTSKGVTSPWRLTLSDGSLTHDAAYQSIDESLMRMEFQSGRTEFNFCDSYHFNIAAYQLAQLLEIGDMLPVCVQRKWKDLNGALCWWLPSKMDEETRKHDNIQPPDLNDWNKQLNTMWVFSELVYDTDRNQTNMLITDDWKLRMIDFPRAFRLSHDLLEPGHLTTCDRKLLEALRRLNEAEVLQKTKSHLTKSQVQAVMARRDKIVALFEKEISQKGEEAVLY